MSKSLSIVIPVYNEEAFLGACLQSIADQTVAPDEVIVVDNNSTDRSVEIACTFDFVMVMHAKEQGIVHARNAGFDATGCDIIGRIDADTILPPDWVSRVKYFYDSAKNDSKALTGGGYFYNIRWPRINGWIQSQLAYRLNRLIVGHYVLWGSNMAFPRHLWLQVRNKVCDRLDIHEDLDLGFHLHDLGCRITYRGNLRVGVCLKRVFTARKQVHAHMRRWPQTLRTHGYRLWWLAMLGNWFLWYLMQPVVFAVEYGARLFGRAPLN
jgi:glycosyltransferase involved in cell wall biosynthesis